jgi:uncharacterized protein
MKKARVFLGAVILALAASVAADAAGPIRAGRAETGPAALIVAAERGDPRAQTYIAFMYETGRGLPQDYVLAAQWYHRAARQGYSRAQHMLGLMYDKGQGVTQDYIQAHKWLNLAAGGSGKRDREYFLRMRNALASKMTVFQVNEAQWLASHWWPVPER